MEDNSAQIDVIIGEEEAEIELNEKAISESAPTDETETFFKAPTEVDV